MRGEVWGSTGRVLLAVEELVAMVAAAAAAAMIVATASVAVAALEVAVVLAMQMRGCRQK